MDDLVDDTRKKVGAPHMKTGIWSGRNVDFDLLMKKDEKSILRDLQESDDVADVENSFDETATSSKLLGNSTGRNM